MSVRCYSAFKRFVTSAHGKIPLWKIPTKCTCGPGTIPLFNDRGPLERAFRFTITPKSDFFKRVPRRNGYWQKVLSFEGRPRVSIRVRSNNRPWRPLGSKATARMIGYTVQRLSVVKLRRTVELYLLEWFATRDSYNDSSMIFDVTTIRSLLK